MREQNKRSTRGSLVYTAVEQRKCESKNMRPTKRRTAIEPHKGDKRYVFRRQKGQLRTEESAGRSLAIDRPHKAKNEAPKGQRDSRRLKPQPERIRHPQSKKRRDVV